MLTRSLASTLPKRFVMFRSSSIPLLLLHRVRYFDLSGDDLLLCSFNGINGGFRNEVFVVFIERIPDTFILQAVNMNSANRPTFHAVLHDLIHSVIDALDHACEYVAGLDPVLIGVHTDDESPCSPLIVFTHLLDGIECAKTGIAGRSENHIRAFLDLRARQFLAFDG